MHERATLEPVLPDLMATDLVVVFCGTAPGTVSAAMKLYYAHPQNKFWRTLHALKLTPRLFTPANYPELLRHGIGLTDIAKHSFGMDNQLPRKSLGASAVSALRARIEEYRPAILAFTSLTGGRKFLGAKAQFGEQTERIGPTRIWVLPSPSPAAHWNWSEKVWRALGEEVRAICNQRIVLPAIEGGSKTPGQSAIPRAPARHALASLPPDGYLRPPRPDNIK